MPETKHYHGDCRVVLASLPEKSVHVVVCSPPYYGLRSYGTQNVVWGGKNDCDHEWLHYMHKGMTGGTKSKKVHVKEKENFQAFAKVKQATCGKCNAWLGCFGLERIADCEAWSRREPPCGNCYICNTRSVMREIRRVLRDDGTLYWNISDSFNSNGKDPKLKKKDLCGIPYRVFLAAQADGWYTRSDIIWHKKNAMPSSAADRFVRDHEYIYMFTKSLHYYFDPIAAMEPSATSTLQQPVMRKKRTIWQINTKGSKAKHYATYPKKLVEPCILASTSEKGCCDKCANPYVRGESDPATWVASCDCTSAGVVPCVVLDPFGGSGTTGKVANDLGRDAILIDLNPEYVEMSKG